MHDGIFLLSNSIKSSCFDMFFFINLSGVTNQRGNDKSSLSKQSFSEQNSPVQKANLPSKHHTSITKEQEENDQQNECFKREAKPDTTSDAMSFLASLSWQNTPKEGNQMKDTQNSLYREEGEGLLSDNDEDEFAALSVERGKPNSDKREIREEKLLSFNDDESETNEKDSFDIDKNEDENPKIFDPFAEFDSFNLNSEVGSKEKTNSTKTEQEFTLDGFTDNSKVDFQAKEDVTNLDFMFDSLPPQKDKPDTKSTKEEDMFDPLNENSSSTGDVNLLGSWDIHNVQDSVPTWSIPRNHSASNIHQSSSASNIQHMAGLNNTSIPRNNSGPFTVNPQQPAYGQSRSGNNSPITTGHSARGISSNVAADPFAELGNTFN